MEELLWTFEDIKGFANHPDAPVRRWALDRLIRHYPKQAGDVVITLIDDQGMFIADKAITFLGKTGEADKYGPVLLECLSNAEGNKFGHLVSTLTQLKYQPAIPVLLKYATQTDKSSMSFVEFRSLLEPLGKFGSDKVRQTLWTLLKQEPPTLKPIDKEKFSLLTMFEADFEPHFALVPIIDALLRAALPEDIPRLIAYYRTLPFDDRDLTSYGIYRHPLSIFAESVGAGRLVSKMENQIDEGLAKMLADAEGWLNADLYLSEACFDKLEAAVGRLFLDVLNIVLQEAQRIVEARNDDLDGWQAAWEAGEGPVGYRQRTLYTMLILQALAAQPKTTLTRRKQEGVLALALLAQLSVDVDDQARIDQAEDKTEALLAILTETREQVLPDIIERVVVLGPDIVPRLIDLLNPWEGDWNAIRIARTIERMARAYPGSCNAAVPKLIDSIYREQGDYMDEAVTDALRAIGPPAVEQINDTLRKTKDSSQEIYLSGVLGEIPVESATQVIVAKVESGEPVGEMEFGTLSDIGSASAIEPLYQLWEPDHRAAHILAEHLLILCGLNGVEKPELAEWRQLIIVQDERVEKMASGDSEPEEDVDPLEKLRELSASGMSLMPTWQAGGQHALSSASRQESAGKKASKQRTIQRKKSKGKKKKRRRR